MSMSRIERAIEKNLRRRYKKQKEVLQRLTALLEGEKRYIEDEIARQADADGYQVMISVGGTELGGLLLSIARGIQLPQAELDAAFAAWIRKQEWHYFVKKSSITPHYQLLIIRWLE